MSKLVAKPESQKYPDSRRGTKSYRQLNTSMLAGNTVRVGQIVRTSARMEKKALKVIFSGFYNTSTWEAKRSGSPKLHGLVDHLNHWAYTHADAYQP